MNKLKIIFAGTEYFSAEYLNALIISSYSIILVISQPDRASGRGQKINFSPVKKISIKNNIPILQPIDLNEKNFQNILFKYHADIMIVVSYGKIIPKNILSAFPMGCINVHASLLPRWRGATPIQSAILHNDKNTGISIIKMNESIDSGHIIHAKKCKILANDTTKSLTIKLIKIGIPTLFEALDKIVNNTVILKKQNEKNITVSKKIYKKDALLNWNNSAIKLERLIRSFNPWPICYFIYEKKIIKVWKAKVIHVQKPNIAIGTIVSTNKYGIQINTSNKILNLEKLQLPGKNIIDVKDIISQKNIFKVGEVI